MVKVPINAVEYDAFISVDDADAYLAADIARSAGWAALTDDQKGMGLVSAARMLVALPWCDGVPDYDTAPDPIPDVNAMLAADVVAKPAMQADGTGSSNIKSLGAGSAKVEFFGPVETGYPIPKALWDQLLAADLLCPGGSESGSSNDGPYYSGACGCDYRPTYGRLPWDYPVACEDTD